MFLETSELLTISKKNDEHQWSWAKNIIMWKFLSKS